MPLQSDMCDQQGPPPHQASQAQDTEWGRGRREVSLFGETDSGTPTWLHTQTHGEEKTARATAGFQGQTDFISSQNESCNFRGPQSTRGLPDMPFLHLTGSSPCRSQAAF